MMVASKGSFSKKSSKTKSKKQSSTVKSSKKESKRYKLKALRQQNKRFKPLVKWTVIVLVSLIIVSLLFYFIGVKPQFLLDNELHIEISPLDASYTVANGQNPTITFNTTILNPVVCQAQCTFTLIDRSRGEVVKTDTIAGQEDASFTYTLPVNKQSRGQKIFNYEVTCYNQRTTLCTSDQQNFSKTAFVTVNHQLSSQQREAKTRAGEDLQEFLEQLALLEKNITQNFDILQQLNNSPASIEQSMLRQDLNSDGLSLASLKSRGRDGLQLWNDREFFMLINAFDDDLQEVENVLFLQSQRRERLEELFQTYNDTVALLKDLQNNESTLQRAQEFFIETNNTQYIAFGNSIEADANALAHNISQHSITSFAQLDAQASQLQMNYQDFLVTYQNQHTIALSSGQSLVSKLHNLIGFFMGGSFSFSSPSQSLMEVSFQSICQDLQDIDAIIQQHNADAAQFRQTNFPFLEDSDLFSQSQELFVNYTQSFVSGQTTQPFTLNDTFESVPTDYPINNGTQTTYNLSTIALEEYKQLTPLNMSVLGQGYMQEYCGSTSSIDSLTFLFSNTVFNFQSPVYENQQSTINTTLPQHDPVCCYQGNCTSCCQAGECEDVYPIVFVHGHSFNKENSPELAFTRLSHMQKALVDEGYIDAGSISKDSQLTSIPLGDWGKMPFPLTVRVTYYYTTMHDVGGYQFFTEKTSSIENYALRLKENVEIIKKRTGRDKVIFIAHSMGGLVVRSYESLFGTDSIHKIILLGTPNHGIEGDVKRFCAVTGGKRECEDMAVDSVFLSNLNQPSNAISEIPVYTVTAHGCQMRSDTGREDGDGVVLARSVPLDFAQNYHINGTCTDFLETNLHMQFVNPAKYPRTLDLVLAFLEE